MDSRRLHRRQASFCASSVSAALVSSLSPEHEFAFKSHTASDTTEKVIKVSRSNRFRSLPIRHCDKLCLVSVANKRRWRDVRKTGPGDEPRTTFADIIELAQRGFRRIDSIGIIEN